MFELCLLMIGMVAIILFSILSSCKVITLVQWVIIFCKVSIILKALEHDVEH